MKTNNEMVLLGEIILPGTKKTIEVEIAELHSMTKLKIPVIVHRAKLAGPVVLLCAGIHGDEINGTEIVRQIIRNKINKPKTGTIICIPIVNIFGYINQTRAFPDQRDLNRVFPGSKNGSLASRFAHFLVTKIIPKVDYAIDFHAGGASRFNAPQIRIAPENPDLKELALVFNAPFTLFSKNIVGSFRNASTKLGVKMLLFEGGKSLHLNNAITQEGIAGTIRFLDYLNMLNPKKVCPQNHRKSIVIKKSNWIRANSSGLFQGLVSIGTFVEKGTVLATISDPFGKVEYKLKAPNQGYIINVNDAAIVYRGDAVFHISTLLEHE